MSGFDLAVLCGLGAASAIGYRVGIRAHLTVWVGVTAGLVFGLVVAWAATRGRTGWSAALIAALGLLISMLLGALTGRTAHRKPIYSQPEPLDRIHGAIAGGLLAAVLVWIVVPVAGAAPATMGERVSASATYDLVEWLPGPLLPVADVAEHVAEGTSDDTYETVQPSSGPPDPVAVPEAPTMTDERRTEVAGSVVGINGIACGRLVEGTGFVIDEQLVATNAHVVAGVDEVRIDTVDGRRVLGRVVRYDPATDVALVSVAELEAASLPLGPTPERDATGEVLGFALDGESTVTPYRIAGEVTATGRDIYGEGEVRRQVLYLAAELDSGDSGAPLMGDQGVVGMVFAIAPGGEPLVFALTPDELELPAGNDLVPVDTGDCR